MQAAYDEVAELYATHFPGTEPEAAVDLAMLEHVLALAAELSGGREPEVLDAGCGTGRISRWLAERGVLVRGIDLSPGMVEVARRQQPDVDFRVGSITALPWANDAFDGVLLWYSTIHGDEADLATALAEAARVLRPSGLVLVAFQVGDGVREIGQGFRALGHEVSLLRYHRPPEQVALAMAAAGFDEVATLVRQPVGAEKDPQAFLAGRVAP